MISYSTKVYVLIVWDSRYSINYYFFQLSGIRGIFSKVLFKDKILKPDFNN